MEVRRDRKAVLCPRHGRKFDVTTGEVVDDDRYVTPTYEVNPGDVFAVVRVPERLCRDVELLAGVFRGEFGQHRHVRGVLEGVVVESPRYPGEPLEPRFREHGLRPYRPPRFADGTPTHEVVSELKADLGVTVTFRSAGEDYREEWGVYVDGEYVHGVGRHRSPSGYTVYEISPDAFETLVREAVGATGP